MRSASNERKLFGTHGVRGVVDVDLTPQMILRLGMALGTFLGGGRVVGIARDPRTSSELLEHAVIAGLLNSGCSIRRFGMTPLPVMSFGVRELALDAGVMISASHNPPEFNGIKMYSSDGSAFTYAQDAEVERLYNADSFTAAPIQSKGRIEEVNDIEERYIKAVLCYVGSDLIIKSRFRVAVDCGGGAASFLTPRLLKALDCEVTEFNCIPDGQFAKRPLEPTRENLSELMALVSKHNAALGVAHDGDADRISFVDERGNFVYGDRILALICHHTLKNKRGGTIVTPINTSSVILDAAELVGAKVEWTPVGEPSVLQRMKETNSEIGGEENLGLMLKSWSWAREGPFTAALILSILAEERKSLSSLLSQYPNYEMVRVRVPFPQQELSQLKGSILEEVQKMLPEGYDSLILMDGVKAFYGKAWLLVRPSGTEPMFRVLAEATTMQRASELATMGASLLKQTIDHFRTS